MEATTKLSIARLFALLGVLLLPGGLFALIFYGLFRSLRIDRVISLNAERQRDAAGAYYLYPLKSWHKHARTCYPMRYWLTETVPARFRRKESP